MEKENQKLEERNGALVSRDKRLELDPKKRLGRLTIQGQQIVEGENERAECEEKTAKEN